MFESIKNTKTINVTVNGAMPWVNFKAIFRGKYHLQVSNDIIIGKYLCAVASASNEKRSSCYFCLFLSFFPKGLTWDELC